VATPWNVATVCQCGNCRSAPWCADQQGRFTRDIPLAGCDFGAGENEVGPSSVIDREGRPQTYYCTGGVAAVNNSTRCSLGQPRCNFGGGFLGCQFVNGCFWTDDPASRMNGRPGAGEIEGARFGNNTLVASRARACGDVRPLSYTCNYNGTMPWAQDLLCPKTADLCNPNVCVSATDDASARTQGTRLIAAFCALGTEGVLPSRPTPAVPTGIVAVPGAGQRPAWICFASGDPAAVRLQHNGCVGPSDPGTSPAGLLFTVDGPRSSLSIGPMGGSGPTSRLGMVGTASVTFEVGGGTVITDLDLHQTGTAVVDGSAVRDGFARIEIPWTGRRNPDTGAMVFGDTAARASAGGTVGRLRVHFRCRRTERRRGLEPPGE